MASDKRPVRQQIFSGLKIALGTFAGIIVPLILVALIAALAHLL
jgi:hypothetical protein